MDKYLIDKIIDVLEEPYFKSLDNIGIDDKELIQDIFNTLYNNQVNIQYDKYLIIISDGLKEYYEYYDGFWLKREHNQNNLYIENSYGYWEKKVYDENGSIVYYQNSI